MKLFSSNIQRVIVGLSFVLLVSAGCAFFLWYQRILPATFREGDKSQTRLVNVEERTILDIEATDEQKKLAKADAIKAFLEHPTFKRDDSQNALSLIQLKNLAADLDKYFDFKEKYRKKYSNIPSDELFTLFLFTPENVLPEQQEWVGFLQLHKDNATFTHELEQLRKDWKKVTLNYPHETGEALLKHKICTHSRAEWLRLRPYMMSIAQKLLNYGYWGSADLTTLKETFPAYNLSPEELYLAQRTLGASLHANIKLEGESLNQLEDSILMEVKPVLKNIPAQSVVLKPGEIITREKLMLIDQLGLNRKTIDWKVFQEAFGTALLITLSFWLYVRFEKFQLGFRQMLLLSFLMIGASAFIGFFGYKQPATIPLAAIAMATGLFFKPTVGFSAGILFGILCLQALGLNPIILIPSFVGVIVGTVLSQKANNRADLAYSGIWLAISQMVSFILIALVSKDVELSIPEITLQGLSGLVTALLVSSGMPYLESLFAVITRFRLLELSDSNQPLLKQLHEEAPGTYEHTLVVADLAQDAAQEIDADDELVRVGILYHDIGKLYNPQYFIENQFGGPNPHETMTPAESARAIIAHVTEGIEMAKKFGLPEPIRAFIPAHQGNSRAGHFFLKARQLDPLLTDDFEFRYPGPKPNSKETGIAMLADTVEATIRSLKTDNKELVQETIKNLIDSRVKDKQLVDSTLTEAELEKIANSFFESWKNKNHERVRYISDLKK